MLQGTCVLGGVTVEHLIWDFFWRHMENFEEFSLEKKTAGDPISAKTQTD